ncbi:hypothetical protein [uncultured Nocardioides sp.]|uniref:hypothetical protein n=1 Tax=uncultured Nocardioides sp. TaxID=198441 RepID=UPI002627C906|nr:hypothetical protein [uncultured Nocardioides sp.]
MSAESDRSNYKLKVSLVSIVFAFVGLALLIVGKLVDRSDPSGLLGFLPMFEMGSTLFITGTLVNVWEYLDGRDRERRDDARVRRLLRESAPEFRDAVVEGFAVSPDDLARVATPELLDGIATNVLALRLGDDQFAREIYADVRDRAIRASERWYDVDVKVRLSAAVERSANGAPLFDILVEWAYTTTPSHAVRKFACVSGRDEFYELVTEVPATSVWFMPARTAVDAASRSSFELLEFDVDGEVRPIRRSTRKTGQTYSVTVPEEVMREQKSVRLRSLYRTVGAQSAHRLFLELPVPARNVTLEVDYTETEIAHLSVTEAVTSLQKPRITQVPERLPGRELQVELPGWLLPRSGFTFVWTLRAEQTERSSSADSAAA